METSVLSWPLYLGLFVPVAGVLLAWGGVWWACRRRFRPVPARMGEDGRVQTLEVEVRGIYAPDRIGLTAGVPAELRFVRQDPAECASRLLIPAFGIDRQLPLGVPVTVTIPNPTPGEFLFTCHHGIYHGHLVVRATRHARSGTFVRFSGFARSGSMGRISMANGNAPANRNAMADTDGWDSKAVQAEQQDSSKRGVQQ